MQEAQSVRFSSILRNIVSPYGTALFSLGVFIVAWIFPPSIYSRVMREPDLLFLEPKTLFFYLLCVIGFGVGFWIICPREIPLNLPRVRVRIPSVVFLSLPLVIGILLVARGVLQAFHDNPNLLLLLAAQQAADLKGANAAAKLDQLINAGYGLVALTWWGLWRYWQFKLRGWKANFVRVLLVVTVLTVVVASIFTISRNLIMETVAGVTILYVLHREAEGRLSWRFVRNTGIVLAAGVVALFGLFSFLRGTTSLDSQLFLLIGYSTASYNRLAGLILGKLHYPFAGRGVYLSTFVSFNEQLHKLIPLDQMFRWPGFFDEWTSEFGAVERAGLNGSMVFLGAFGFLFCDLGWMSPLWTLGYGLLYGVLWRAMRRASIAGVLIYPFAGFCALFWFGTNLLLDSSFVPFVKYTIVLFVFERLFLEKVSGSARESAQPL